MACKLYISLHTSSFSNSARTIKWALSYMNVGHAANLAQEILEDNANMFLDWAAFESWFLSEFTYPNKAQCAALRLEGTSYHQQGCTLDTYVNGFKLLVWRLGFPRSVQLVLCFRQGLNPTICKRIDGMVDRCPGDEDIKGWITAVRLVDQNAHAD